MIKMEGRISIRMTLEGWMDKQLLGEKVRQRDLDVIIVEDSERIIVLSEKPLNEEEKRQWWGHVKDKSDKKIEYSFDEREYLRYKADWVAYVDKFKAEFNERMKHIVKALN